MSDAEESVKFARYLKRIAREGGSDQDVARRKDVESKPFNDEDPYTPRTDRNRFTLWHATYRAQIVDFDSLRNGDVL